MAVDVVRSPTRGNYTLFLSGPPGSGKTTLAVGRLLHLLEQGTPAEQILVLVPQRTLATPFDSALRASQAPRGGRVDIATIGGLARQTSDLFWPLVAEEAGFATKTERPRFLTLETAQYHMARVVEPYVSAGAFDGITLPRARLISQIIDNLNKAAAVGFAVEEIGPRLRRAWGGESSRLHIYDQIQEVASAFRHYCLAHNLLDWSLQIELFRHHLLPLPQVRRYLLGGYRHLIVDNIEEDIPATHDLLREWLPSCESALLIFDNDGGYRVFLGASPTEAVALGQACRERLVLAGSNVASAEVAALGQQLAATLVPSYGPAHGDGGKALAFPAREIRFYPQMLDWVAEQVSSLVMAEGIPPTEIAVLAPIVGDALRFLLVEKLARFGIVVRTHRPSRELNDEPAARCLLTLAKLAHPTWRRPPPCIDVALSLGLAIADLDPVRARLLTDVVYRVRDGQPALTSFDQIIPDTQRRIGLLLGKRYDELWHWLQTYVRESESQGWPVQLGHFWSRLFGELLSQAGFGFFRNVEAGSVTANLLESVRKFRHALSPLPKRAEGELGLEYIDTVEQGILASQYPVRWPVTHENAVLLAPVHAFLMLNRSVTCQFWLDAGSPAWAERIYQPLTHPYVLRRDWEPDAVWTDEDEVRIRRETLARLVLGLCRRCRDHVYVAYSMLDEQGLEQQGLLLQALGSLMRRWRSDGR